MRHEPLSSGQLARAAGVNVETLRFYERRGLLPAPARTVSGHRRYSGEALGLLRVIKRAQVLGFSLAEIGGLLGLRHEPGASCREACRAVRAKLDHVEHELARLRALRGRLQRLKDACPRTRPLKECPVIEELESEPRKERRKSR